MSKNISCTSPLAAASCRMGEAANKPKETTPRPDFKIRYCYFIRAATTTHANNTQLNTDGGCVDLEIDNSFFGSLVERGGAYRLKVA